MKIYKCDTCGKYVDDVFSLDVSSNSHLLSHYEFCIPATKFYICKNCFRNLMQYIYEVRKNHGLEE